MKTKEEIREIHTNLFLDPDQIYISVEENRIYYIDDNNDFRIYESEVPIVDLTYDDCFNLVGKPPSQ